MNVNLLDTNLIWTLLYMALRLKSFIGHMQYYIWRTTNIYLLKLWFGIDRGTGKMAARSADILAAVLPAQFYFIDSHNINCNYY